MVGDRGQIHTLEAVVAALLIVGALLFASQATAVTPLSASTSNQHIENQQQTMAEDVLAIASSDSSLQEALTYWNTSSEDRPAHFRDSDPNLSVYSSVSGTEHPLNQTFSKAFGDGIHAYNVELRYLRKDGELATTDLIVMGTPSDNAVTATRTVALFDHDQIPTNESLIAIEEDFWASDIDENSSLFNVVEVRMTVWRM